ncbi:MAG: M20/M25/M40 family metallo-hydrolase [Sphingopyxis sp.]|nr:M20/M25/M40 family metallo-hydrolase [Sphingopyxis sp.]
MMRFVFLATAVALAHPVLPAAASEADGAANHAPLDAIVDEASNRSEVMRIAQYLTDVIGARLTNSPGMRAAEDWTAGKFRQWGMENVRKEGVEFGRGWSNSSVGARMVTPRRLQLTAAPLAWTPGTGGPVTAPVVVAPLLDEQSFASYRGKLKGRIVLVSGPRQIEDAIAPAFRRWTDEELAKRGEYDLPNGGEDDGSASLVRRIVFASARDAFLKEEGALAFVSMSGRDNKLVHGQYSGFEIGKTPAVPGFELAAEDYRRLVRLANMGASPTLELESKNAYHDEDGKTYSILADIPGANPRDGYILAGAHLDSWAVGDGAADNAAGVAVVMEAARIIKALNIRPRRTIRFALWAGEEQGLFGSLHYVETYVATRTVDPAVPAGLRRYAWAKSYPVIPGRDYRTLSVYFNMDNGSGRIRGINTQGNLGVVPLFRKWLAPFEAMGASTVSARRSPATDHFFFDAVGIPAFQFIQDPLDYASTVHHTDADTYDHLKSEDLRQSAIVLASILVEAANAPDLLPRVPLPTAPRAPDGQYPYPERRANR